MIAAIAAFESALSAEDYKTAKRRAARLDTVHQFALVDTIKAARSRLLANGVAL